MDPSAANPLPATIVDVNLSTLVLILGIFFIIVGIIIAGVVYRESREWKKLVLPMFDRNSTEMASGSSNEADSLTSRRAAFGKEIFGRVFTHMDIAGLLGGAAIVIMGAIVVLIGFALGS
jgi:hypothetical protein